MVQKLIQFGYALSDIKEMVSLFQRSIADYQEIFKHDNQQMTLKALHKLKGGLRILQFSELIDDADALEKAIKLDGIKHNKPFLIRLIEECSITSNRVLSVIDDYPETIRNE
ncbi:MAG: Hpt domain-containing protein [Bacteroidetes bacterium]|nr:Hpt domain-containing protein [Bacteroidota bacterium]